MYFKNISQFEELEMQDGAISRLCVQWGPVPCFQDGALLLLLHRGWMCPHMVGGTGQKGLDGSFEWFYKVTKSIYKGYLLVTKSPLKGSPISFSPKKNYPPFLSAWCFTASLKSCAANITILTLSWAIYDYECIMYVLNTKFEMH